MSVEAKREYARRLVNRMYAHQIETIDNADEILLDAHTELLRNVILMLDNIDQLHGRTPPPTMMM